MAREQEIPFVFALGRKALGRCVNKLVPVSVVGIFNYSGAEASFFYCVLSVDDDSGNNELDLYSALLGAQSTLRSIYYSCSHCRPVKCLSLRPQGLFNRLVSLTEEARKAYKDMVSALEQEQAEEALKNDKKTPHQLGHYRNHSAASAISFCSILSEPISEVNEKEYG